jgi:hypothetical protein
VLGAALSAGSHAVDVALVQDFTLSGGTLQATLTDDDSKLIHPIPQVLSQSTVALTVN